MILAFPFQNLGSLLQATICVSVPILLDSSYPPVTVTFASACRGVDQLDFLSGKRERSNRDSVIIYVGNDIFGVKWRNWKMMSKVRWTGYGQPVSEYNTPLFFDLLTDPKEEHPADPRLVEDLWARFPISKALGEHLNSLHKEPPIAPGTPDPYVPKPAAPARAA